MTFDLDHVQLAMPEGGETRARAFWGGLLGHAEIDKPEALQGQGGCWFRLAKGEIHIGVETPFRPARKAHPAFRVDALDAIAQQLAAGGFAISWDGRIPGQRRFFSEDPFGNRLEFWT